MIEQFREAIQAAGLTPPPEVVSDGVLHRYPTNGRADDDSGWYILHGDGIPAGSFGCWRTGAWKTWCAKSIRVMSEAEKTAHKAKLQRIKRQREEERERRQAEARANAARIWKSATPPPADHPYLARKGVKAFGLKAHNGALLVPMREGGELHSIQFIDAEGGKKFLPGGRVKGCYHAFGGDPGKAGVLCVVEGYATGASVHEATGYPVAVAFNAGNVKAVAEALRAKFPDVRLILCGDDDYRTEGNPGVSKATEAALAVGGMLAVPDFGPDRLEDGTDFNDLAAHLGLDAVKTQIEASQSAPLLNPSATPEVSPQSQCEGRLRVVDAMDFMKISFPPRENILAPWLPMQGLAMVYAPRGVGKTFFSLGVAYAVASGGKFLTWHAPTPRGVLLLDGEMPGVTLQERLANIAVNSEKDLAAPFSIVTPDMQSDGMIDLSRAEDQAELAPHLEGVSLIVVDNLATLCRTGKENEGESWMPVQGWALQQRAAGRSVLFIHHAGKGGAQRGTSRREDVLDTVIALKRPGDYTPDKGGCFEVHFEKARGIYGNDVRPFEVQFVTSPGGLEWATKPLEQSTAEKVAALLNEGVAQKEIAELLGITPGAVSKAKQKAQELGLVKVS